MRIHACMWGTRAGAACGTGRGMGPRSLNSVEELVRFGLTRLCVRAHACVSSVKEFVHFGLTSQDINNTCYPLMILEFYNNEYLPTVTKILTILDTFARKWKDVPLLARTHGQAASPTRMGKEVYVFVDRLRAQVEMMEKVPFNAKFGGATGNFNAHNVAYPDRDWVAFGNELVASLGLQRLQCTTQIEHYDNMAALFDACRRINTILIDLARDVWTYISQGLFKQKTKAGEIGSSAMPHKVNPIDFENAEGNFGVANALFDHLSMKLPISRLQRDLTDSTVTRNISVPFGHTLVALESMAKGLGKLLLDEQAVRADLNNNWAVTAEAIQTILRREGVDGAYELLKEETRGAAVTAESVQNFVKKLEGHATIKLAPGVLDELRRISPESYTGVFTPGVELEAWAEQSVGKRCQPAVLKAIASTRTSLATDS